MSIKTVALVVAGWLVAAGTAGLTLLPHVPATWTRWVALVVFGPLVYVVFEALGSWLFSPAHGKAISAKPFSFRRIGFVVLAVVLAAVAVLGVFAIW